MASKRDCATRPVADAGQKSRVLDGRGWPDGLHYGCFLSRSDDEDFMVGKLAGKVAFLTGAGAGIAKATAKLFVNEGAKVAIIEIKRDPGERAEREIREQGGEALYVETDVTKDESVKRAVEATVARF